MNKKEINKKDPMDIIFRAQGGELLYWKYLKGKNKDKLQTSIFVETKYISHEGGIHWVLLTDNKQHVMNPNRIELWDCHASYH